MKLSEFKKHLQTIEQEMFAWHKISSPMGTCPDDPEIIVTSIDGGSEEPLLFFDTKTNKIIL